MIASLFSGFLFFFFSNVQDKRRDFSDCNSSLRNGLVFSHSRPADTGADSPSFLCSSAQRLRKKLFPSLHGQSALQVGAGLVPEEKQRNGDYAEKLPHEMGK